MSIASALLLASCTSSRPKVPEPGAPPPVTAPTDYAGMIKAARSYTEAGRPEQAEAVAKRAAARDPGRPEAYCIWGRSLAQQKKLKESAEKYEMARQRGVTDRECFIELASVYDVSGRYHEAVDVYRAYLKKSPDDTEMRQELGLTFLLLQRFDEAVAELEKAVSTNPDDLQLQQDLGYALVRGDWPAEAAKVLERVLARDPSAHQATLFLARARAALGMPLEAMALVDQLITGRKASEQALRMRAHLRHLTDNAAGALDDYQWLLKAKPDDAAALLGAAGALIALGRIDAATKTVARAVEVLEKHPLIDFRQAQIAWRHGEAKALGALVKYARRNPTHVEAWREVRAAAKTSRDRKLEQEATAKLRDLGDLEKK
ncbi:MAG: tetratricopeptide repeat protein [Myxococcota bacterium]